MASILRRARKIAWNIQDSSKTDNQSFDSGYAEPKSYLAERPIQRISRSAGFEKFAKALKRDGCVVVKDFTDMATLQQANAEVEPFLENERVTDSQFDGWRGRTKTVTQLMRRSPTIREKFFTDELYQLLCELFLSTETVTWSGNTACCNISHPLLSSAITFETPPGASAQGLHRDDQYYHARHSEEQEYELGRDMLLGLFVPGSNHMESTAIPIVLGSHLWGDGKPPLGGNCDTPIAEVPLLKGEALIMLGSVYYGGFTSQPAWGEIEAQPKLMHAMFSCSGIYRQEENPFLTYTSEEVKKYSELVQERLGWRQNEPSLGWVDLKSPDFLLKA